MSLLLLAFLGNEIHHRLPEGRQSTMEKMFATWDDQQLWPWLEAIYPFDCLFNVYELVLVTLNNQPWAVWL